LICAVTAVHLVVVAAAVVVGRSVGSEILAAGRFQRLSIGVRRRLNVLYAFTDIMSAIDPMPSETNCVASGYALTIAVVASFEDVHQ
jgi:hypothetical protein